MNKSWIYILFIVLLLNNVFAAFSTPYLENGTIRLNESNEYEFEIVFQNTKNIDTVMHFEVIEGKEWTEPDYFDIEVGARVYDAKGSFNISVPEMLESTNKSPIYGQPYEIQYSISEGNPDQGGMVPITSQVKKSFNVVPIEDPEHPQLKLYLYAIIGSILVALLYVYIRAWRNEDKDGQFANEE